MFIPQSIPDVIVIEPKRFGDARGYFSELYSFSIYREGGIRDAFVQDNVSLSAVVGTLRGLHFQTPPAAQAKLLTCLAGAILDVAVDIRPNSRTFGQHVAVELLAETGRQIYIPVGFAHGFCTLTGNALVHYKTSAAYDPACERGIAWNDPDLAIAWPLPKGGPTLSARDNANPQLKDWPAFF